MTQFASASGFISSLHGYAHARILRPHLGSSSGRLTLKAYARPHVPPTWVNRGSFGYLHLKSMARAYLNEPYGSFRDFAHYGASAVDPAMVLIRAHNGGALSSDLTQTSGYRRYYAIASSPLDYTVSNAKKAWSRAAYASVGLKFKGLVNAGYEYIDSTQFGIAKYAATGPLPYQPARALNCVIHPTAAQLASPELTNQIALVNQLLAENCPLGVIPAVPTIV